MQNMEGEKNPLYLVTESFSTFRFGSEGGR
jgi:hypothetical protein